MRKNRQEELWLIRWRTAIGKRLRLLLEALKKFDDDNGFFLSSGITFNLLLCFVPLLLLLLALMGTYLYTDREVLNHIRRYIESAIPSLDPRIMKNILRIIQDRKIVGGLGIGGLIWTSTWVFSSLRTALNVVFQVEKRRGILQGKAIDLLMVFLAGLFLWVSMLLTSSITFLQGYRVSSLHGAGTILRFVLKYLLPLFFTYWMALFIYKIIPNRKVGF
jgi:membrane protein